jgi:hypothetical protein
MQQFLAIDEMFGEFNSCSWTGSLLPEHSFNVIKSLSDRKFREGCDSASRENVPQRSKHEVHSFVRSDGRTDGLATTERTGKNKEV